MSVYETVLMDIDNTLFDFDRTEEVALRESFDKFDLMFTTQILHQYREKNRHLWALFEEGKIEKEEIVNGRFDNLAEESLTDSQKSEMNEYYIDRLSKHFFPCEHALELCKKLYGKCKMYIVTNGVKKVQDGRLALSGFLSYLDGIFISDEMGAQKPTKEFFDIVFNSIENKDRSKAIILGDSLTSDMKGGRNAGITTCRILQKGEAPSNSELCDYEITDLLQFADIVLGT